MTSPLPSSPRLVRDLMTVGVPTCPPETLLVDLARMMLEKDIEAVIVLDPEERTALGFVNRDDLVGAYHLEGVRQLTAGDVMRVDIPQVPPDIPLEAAAQIMRDQHVRSLFLMHHAGGMIYPAAMITYKHLIRHLIAGSDEELRDLGIEAERKSPIETFIERRDAAREAARRKTHNS